MTQPFYLMFSLLMSCAMNRDRSLDPPIQSLMPLPKGHRHSFAEVIDLYSHKCGNCINNLPFKEKNRHEIHLPLSASSSHPVNFVHHIQENPNRKGLSAAAAAAETVESK